MIHISFYCDSNIAMFRSSNFHNHIVRGVVLFFVCLIFSVSALCPTSFTTKHLYSHKHHKQRKVHICQNPIFIGEAFKPSSFILSPPLIATRYRNSLILVSSDSSNDEPERKRFSQFARSYKFVGRFFKRIFNLLKQVLPGQSKEFSLDEQENENDIPARPQSNIVPFEKVEPFSPIPQFVEDTVQQTVQLVGETVQILTEPFSKVEPFPQFVEDTVQQTVQLVGETVQILTESVSKMIQMDETTTEIPPIQPLQSSNIISSPKGMRWAIASPTVDLSGNWKILVDDHFKKDYDTYLVNLGQPSLVRTVATSIVELTTELVRQEEEGRVLYIQGKNLRGVWERTLLASGSDRDHDHLDEEHLKTSLVTADQENVEAEAWWEDNGTVHRSFLRGVKKYGGGDFESKRYLMDNGNTLVCESIFHPRDEEKQEAKITWKFVRI